MSKKDAARQIEALEELYAPYHRLERAEPIRREATTPAGWAALGASFKARCWNLKDLGPCIVAARKKLLATGFIVPDSWLTVRTTGNLSICRPGFRDARAKGKKPTAKQIDLLVLTDEGPDVAGLAAICREIEAAMLRLEAAPQQEAADTAPPIAPKPSKNVAPWIAAAVKIAAKAIRAAKGRTVKAQKLISLLPCRESGSHMTEHTFRKSVGPVLLGMGFASSTGAAGGYYAPHRRP